MKATLVDGTQAEGTPDEIAALIQAIRGEPEAAEDATPCPNKHALYMDVSHAPLVESAKRLAILPKTWATEIACSFTDYQCSELKGSYCKFSLIDGDFKTHVVKLRPDPRMPPGRIEVRR